MVIFYDISSLINEDMCFNSFFFKYLLSFYCLEFISDGAEAKIERSALVIQPPDSAGNLASCNVALQCLSLWITHPLN